MKKAVAVMVLIWACFATVHCENGDLKKQTYFRIGYSIPSWKYFGIDGRSEWSDESRRVGGIFEVGNLFMINSLKLSPGMRIGINVDYLSVNFHRFHSNENDASENLVFVGSKIGPSFSYSPVQRLVFDAYIKFNPVWVSGDVTSIPETFGGDRYYLGFLGVKYSFGLNIRYAILMAGFEINPGFVRMKLYDEENSEFTDTYRSNVNDNSNKTPVPGVNFTIGLSF